MLFWTRKEQIQCAVSAASVVAFLYILIVVLFDFAWTAILVRHFVPVMIMNYWLVMVTYLQHHEEDTNVSLCAVERKDAEPKGIRSEKRPQLAVTDSVAQAVVVDRRRDVVDILS